MISLCALWVLLFEMIVYITVHKEHQKESLCVVFSIFADIVHITCLQCDLSIRNRVINLLWFVCSRMTSLFVIVPYLVTPKLISDTFYGMGVLYLSITDMCFLVPYCVTYIYFLRRNNHETRAEQLQTVVSARHEMVLHAIPYENYMQ